MILKPSYEQTVEAARIISRYHKPTPLNLESGLCDYLDSKVFVKHEFQSPVRSFKIRGALNLVHHLKARGEVSKIITASTGNHGASMAFACQKFGMRITIGVPVDADKSKVALIKEFDAKLEFIGRDLDETKEFLLTDPLPDGVIFIEDGSSPEIVTGTATIGLEIITERPNLDIVFVPVGNGALIGGIGSILKERNSHIKLIGVQSELAPCMALSFKVGGPVNTETCDTFASGMAVRVAIPEAVELMLEVVDDMILVSETELKKAMGLYYRFTGHMLEGAGAAALAGAEKMRSSVKNKNVCLIASGMNVDEALKREILANFV